MSIKSNRFGNAGLTQDGQPVSYVLHDRERYPLAFWYSVAGVEFDVRVEGHPSLASLRPYQPDVPVQLASQFERMHASNLAQFTDNAKAAVCGCSRLAAVSA